MKTSGEKYTLDNDLRTKARAWFGGYHPPTAIDVVRARGMDAWSGAVNDAARVRLAEIERMVSLGGRFGAVTYSDTKPNEAEEIAMVLADWLANVFRDGRQPQPEEVDALRRAARAVRVPGDGPVKGEARDRAIAKALAIVEEHAARYVSLQHGSQREECASALAVDLWGWIAEGFDRIVPSRATMDAARDDVRDRRIVEKVGEWLERYESGPGRRTADGAGDGKMSGAALLAELNKMAGSPLGPIDAHAISNAVGRYRDRIPNPGT